jgi:hypothetical protein
VKSPPPRFARLAAFGTREEVLERDVQKGPARFGENLPFAPKLAVDVNAAPAALGHPSGDLELPVDEHGTPVADEDPCGHRRKPVPRREEAACLVERGADEPAVDDSRSGLVRFSEGKPRLVALDPLFRRPREVDAVRVLLPATPTGAVMVRRDVYLRPPRSKCAL